MVKKKDNIEENKKQIIQTCIDRRIELGLDQTRLAEKIGCSISMIWRFEKNESWPGIKLLVKIFDGLDLEMNLTKKNT